MLPAVNMLPQQRQALARLSVSALVASLPLLYVSLLRPPPSALPGDTAFWFLMSNCVVAAIVAAADAGTLFSAGSKQDDRLSPCDDDGNHSYGVSGCHPVAFQDSCDDAVVPALAPSHVELPAAVDMTAIRAREELASTMASSASMDRALPFSIQGEDEGHGDAAATTAGTDMSHALVPQQVEGDEVIIEPVTEKNTTVKVAGQGGEGTASLSPASDEAIAVDDLATTTKADRALAVPAEPWPSPVITSESTLVEEVPDPIARCSCAADVLQDESTVAARKENSLRRSATEGSRPAAEEESEYSELSDEQLNRRVEEFIARFNREMRLQVEQEAAGVV